MSDFLLSVGIDTSLSYGQMKSDMTSLVSQLNSNPPKIKIQIDKANVQLQLSSLEKQIKALSKTPVKLSAVGGLDSLLRTNFGAFNDSLKSISTNIDTIAKKLATVDDASGLKTAEAQVTSFKTELNALSQALNNFQGINLNLSAGKTNAAANAVSVGLQTRQTVKDLKVQAQEIELVIKSYYRMADEFTAAMNLITSANIMDPRDFVALTDVLYDAKAKPVDQIVAWKEYINVLQKAASIKGIDLSQLTSSFSRSADQIVADTQKVLTGEQQLENGLSNLRSIFGSSINAEELNQKLNNINSSVMKVANSLDNINLKSDTFNNLTESIKAATQALKELVPLTQKAEQSTSTTSGTTKTDGTVLKYKEAAKAVKEYYAALTQMNKAKTDISNIAGVWSSPSGTYNDIAETLNRTQSAFDAVKASMQSLPAQQQVQIMSLMISELEKYNSSLAKQAESERKAAQAAEEKANKLKESANASKSAAKEQENTTKELNKQAAAISKAEKLINQIKVNASKWTAASSGSTAENYKSYVESAKAIELLVAQFRQGEISAETFAQRFSTLSKQVQKDSTAIKVAGKNTLSMFDKVGALTQKFGAWLSVTTIMMKAIQTAKQMANASIEIEDAMTQLKIVTGSTDSQMEVFLVKATSLAKELGKSITDVASSIETFSRLGYNLEDASELAEYANILSNVANTDVDTATTGLTSIIKGYNMDVSQAEHVADVLVKVGQEYAISAEELMAAFQRGGAALYASGTDFEKSAALFAATNASLQNAEAVGTMWKTVSARIRGATTELEEMGEDTEGLADGLSKYRSEILALSGVDIMKDANTYKDMYNIFVELAQVWDKMRSDEARSRIAEILGGTRQLSGIMSTITNISDAIGAYEGALDSAGTSMQANNLYMETTTAHIQQLKASFQDLSSSFLETDFLKFWIDALRKFIEALDAVTDTFGSLITIVGAIGITKSLFNVTSVIKELGGLKTAISSVDDMLEVLSLAFPKLSALITGTTGAIGANATVWSLFTAILTKAKVALLSFLATPVGPIVAIGVAIAGVVTIASALTESFEEAQESAAEARDAYASTKNELSELKDELSSTKARIQELESLGTLTMVEEQELERLKSVTEELELQLSIKQKLASYQQQEVAKTANNVLTKKSFYGSGGVSTDTPVIFYGDIIDETNYKQTLLNEKQAEYVQLLKELDNLKPGDNAYKHKENQINNLQKEISTLESDISENLASIDAEYDSLFDDNGHAIAGYEDTVNRINDVVEKTTDSIGESSNVIAATTENINSYASAISNLKTRLSNFQSYQDEINSAMEASASATGLSIEQIDQLIDYYKNLDGFDTAKLFEETANGVHLNTEELSRLNEEYANQERTRLLEQERDILQDIYATRANGGDTSGLESELNDVRLLINSYEGLTSAYNNWLSAKSGTNERDSYESVGAGYDDMKEILDGGWYGDDSLNAYLDLLLSVEKRTGDAITDFNQLNETIEGTSHSLMDYWQYDGDKLVTDGLFDFLDDVNAKLGDSYARQNEDGLYEFDFDGDKLQEVADAFGTTTEVVELFERAMIDAGMAVDLSDLTLPEEINKIADDLNAFKESGVLSDSLNLDFDVEMDSLDDVKSTIDDLKSERIEIDADANPELAKMLDDLIAKCEEQYLFRLNAETNGSLDNAVSLVLQMKALTAAPITVESRVANEDRIAELAAQLAALPEEVQTAVGVSADNVGSVDGIIQQLNTVPSSINVPVGFTPDPSAAETAIANIENTTIHDKEFDITANNKASSVISTIKLGLQGLVDKSITVTTYEKTVKVGKADGTAHAFGTAFANGTTPGDAYRSTLSAYVNGQNWSLMRDEEALVNEIGTESIVRNGIWYPIPGGAHIAQLKKGDIIFSADQTKELIRTGKVISGGGHGKVAYADGTAFNTLNLSAYDKGTSGQRRPNSSNISVAYKNSGYSSVANYSSSNDYSKTNSDDFKESIDWIEIAIQRITEAIDRLKIIADSTFKTLTKRNNALGDEIVMTSEKIDLQNKAYERYLKEANSVGLDEEWAKKVRLGAIDIELITDEALVEQIKKYQEYYDKAIECKDAVAELNEEISELYQSKFDNIATDFENQLSLIEHLTNTYENGIDNIEAKGYLESSKFYSAMQGVEKQNIEIQKQALASLSAAMSDAVNSGAIEEGSEAWYDMQQQINETKEAIQESETAVIEFANSVREVEWGHFDYLQGQISNISKEADFLIQLMENSDLFQDNGQLTDEGMATMGLHGQNYNVYMNQADQYAEAIKKLNTEIANDPNNTKLISRREELLELQRESILAAEDEKQAMISMVEEGIQLELDSLQSLIDAYTKSLDGAKNLYDYQKKIKDKTSEIAQIQKQISAYGNDTSDETRSVVQKLNVELKNAEDDLEEMQYERYISDVKDLLDSFYIEYELILNQRLDNIDLLISDMINSINSNALSINSTLITASEQIGYTISTEMKGIWDLVAEQMLADAEKRVEDTTRVVNQLVTNGVLSQQDASRIISALGVGDAQGVTNATNIINQLVTSGELSQKDATDIRTAISQSGNDYKGVISTYGEDFRTKSTTTNTILDNIKINVANMVARTNEEAQKTINSQQSVTEPTSSTSSSNTSTKPQNQTQQQTSNNQSTPAKQITIGGKINAGNARIYATSSGTGGGSQYFGSDPIYTVVDENNGYLLVRHHSVSSGYTGWFKKSDVKAYKTGGLIDYDGLAMVHGEDEPELVLNSKDTKNFISLRDALRNAASQKILLDGVFSTPSLYDMNNKVSNIDLPRDSRAVNIGDVTYEINIPIDHVADYDDFMNQMRNDGQFEKFLQSVTVDRLVGGSSLSKNKYKW